MSNLNRETLLKIASLIRPALATQTFIPAYNHIAFDGKRAMTHNDIAAISIKCEFPEACCVPGELLIKALGSFGGENLMVQRLEAGQPLLITSGRSKLKVPTMPIKSFPFEMPEPDPKGASIKLTAEVISAIDQVLVSAGTNPNHPSTMGVTLDVDDSGKAVLFATDNYTISRHATYEKLSLPADAPVVMPTFFCNQLITLSRAFPEHEKAITLYIMRGALLVEIGEEGKAAQLFTKTIDDLEPLDFHKIIKKHVDIGKLDKLLAPIPDAFDAAFSRQLLVLGAELDKVTAVNYNDGTMKLRSTSQVGESDESFAFDGPDDRLDFYVDPTFVARGSKLCDKMALGDRVLVMSGDKEAFLHIIAHVAAPKKD